MALKSDQLPIVSIVVPLRHDGGSEVFSVDSFLAHGYPNIEIVAVGRCPNVAAVDFVGAYEPRVRVVCVPEPIRLCLAWNIGLSHAIGEFVLFHNSDDLIFPDRLWSDLEVLSGEPETDAVVSINRWFRDGEKQRYDPEPICRRERRLRDQMATFSLGAEESLIGILQNGVPQRGCILYRTSVVRSLGGYTDAMDRYADRELLFRVLCSGSKVRVNPRVTSAWHWHEPSEEPSAEGYQSDHVQRLALAKSCAAALERTGLRRSRSLNEALIGYVECRVYDYARVSQKHAIAVAALNLLSNLRLEDEAT